jgi:hypothetical protein
VLNLGTKGHGATRAIGDGRGDRRTIHPEGQVEDGLDYSGEEALGRESKWHDPARE